MAKAKDPTTKPGEANGEMKPEQKAAEQAPDTAKETNPVGEATQHESKDPYAEGKHIANPEPNNGQGENEPDFDGEPAEEVTSPDAATQDEVAEGREEPDPLAEEANEKSV